MADIELENALIRAFENPTVEKRLVTAPREEILENFKEELNDLKEK